MKLEEFFRKAGAQAVLAKAIGAHAPDLSRWAAGLRPVPVGRCVAIEQATHGAVRRWDLRPSDWHVIWPELVAHPDAPRPPETVRAA